MPVCQCTQNNGAKRRPYLHLYAMFLNWHIAVLACAVSALFIRWYWRFFCPVYADRIQDAQCSIVVTSDGGFRGSKDIELKSVMMMHWCSALL
jgi:acetyl-CoA synthetase